MGLRLAVERDAWTRQLSRTAQSLPGLIPVVKGNGYGFGRLALMPFAVEHTGAGAQIAVGTVYEAADVPVARRPLVLTPHVAALPRDLHGEAVLTVGSGAHVRALEQQGWRGPVAVKLASSMRRYGVLPNDLDELLGTVLSAGCSVDSYSIHLPLVGTPASHIEEIVGWVAELNRSPASHPPRPISVSHLGAADYAALRDRHPEIEWRHRAGTALWLGDKGLVHLTADVLDVRAVSAGESVGYRGLTTPAEGHLLMVAAGSAHGVRALDDGRSPFHHARRRLTLIEPPHMHTSMVFVPQDEPLPAVGERVDVQRPLTTTAIDELLWLP